MNISDVSCESMEVDKSSNSVKSANDSISDYFNKVNLKSEAIPEKSIFGGNYSGSSDGNIILKNRLTTHIIKTPSYEESGIKTAIHTPEGKITRIKTRKSWGWDRPSLGNKYTPFGNSVTTSSPIQDNLSLKKVSPKIIPEKAKEKTYYNLEKIKTAYKPLQKSSLSSNEGTINTTIIKLNHKKFDYRQALIRTSSVALCLAIVIYFMFNVKCLEHVEISKLHETLKENIFGQNVAISEIVSAMDMQSTSKVLFLYGGTGVGKTYTVSLMMNDLWDYSNVYHYTMPSFREKFTSDGLVGLILCKSNIFIVDGLTSQDLDVHTQVQAVIKKSTDLKHTITVILIYNCDTVNSNFVRDCDSIFVDTLKHSFNELNVLKQFIKFEPLKEEHLRKCIQAEIGSEISEVRMQEYLKNFDVTADGCKGVPSKVKFLNMM